MKSPLMCPDCEADLLTVGYTKYGRKVFKPDTGDYVQDQSWGGQEMDLFCPNCFTRLDLNDADYLRLL